MYQKKIEDLKAKARKHAQSARELAEKADAEKRGLTTTEQSQYDADMKAAGEKIDEVKALKGMQDQMDDLAALGGPVGKSSAPVGRKAWGRTAVKSIRQSMGSADGQKSITSGSITLANPVSPGVTPLGATPTTVLDLLRGDMAAATGDDYGRELAGYKPHYETEDQYERGLFGGGGGNTFSYLRQTVRDNKAAPVADGAEKPTSIYTFEEIEDRYRVIAHLSEPVPLRFFHDDRALGDFLANEMGYGLEVATEAQALAGDGLGENFTGILNTDGILEQAWAVDLLTTLRKAVTSLQVSGIDPSALVLHPTDAERVDLLREGEGTGKYLIGDPAGEAVQALWRVPRVTSVAVPVGTAVLGDWNGAELKHRQEAVLHIDTGGDLFKRNQVQFRVESRPGLAVTRPGAFVKVDVAQPVA
ncbi:phage major capsid protein [Cellulosimicrobium funkei]|nr:phage major capsid protein [Cellulosimicrobium funkei]